MVVRGGDTLGMLIFTQVWVVCLVGFAVGALLTWLFWVRPVSRRMAELQVADDSWSLSEPHYDEPPASPRPLPVAQPQPLPVAQPQPTVATGPPPATTYVPVPDRRLSPPEPIVWPQPRTELRNPVSRPSQPRPPWPSDVPPSQFMPAAARPKADPDQRFLDYLASQSSSPSDVQATPPQPAAAAVPAVADDRTVGRRPYQVPVPPVPTNDPAMERGRVDAGSGVPREPAPGAKAQPGQGEPAVTERSDSFVSFGGHVTDDEPGTANGDATGKAPGGWPSEEWKAESGQLGEGASDTRSGPAQVGPDTPVARPTAAAPAFPDVDADDERFTAMSTQDWLRRSMPGSSSPAGQETDLNDAPTSRRVVPTPSAGSRSAPTSTSPGSTQPPAGQRGSDGRSLFDPVIEARPTAIRPAPPAEAESPEPPSAPAWRMGPFGPGSALPLPGGSAPSPQFRVKARTSSMVFHTESSPFYERLEPQVWFRSVEDAQRAGFTSWDRPRPW